MATLAAIAKERKQDLKTLMYVSRKLDAAQEKLERECKRLLARKRSVPELADAERLINLIVGVDTTLNAMMEVVDRLANAWGMQYN